MSPSHLGPERVAEVLDYAGSARGFLPPDEGRALYENAAAVGLSGPGGPWLEVGSYCASRPAT